MSTLQLGTLRSLARERADQVGSAFVADTSIGLDRWINEGLSRLHTKLVEAYGNDYVESSSALSLVAGTSDYNLPSDFLKLYGVDVNIGGRYFTMLPFNQAERNAYRNSPHPNHTGPRYKLSGSKLRVYPTTLTATGAILYAPTFTQLVNVGDGCTFPEMWETYGVLWAARELLAKEESSVRFITEQLDKMDRELETLKENRDAAHPGQVVDVDAVGDLYWGI